MVKLVNNLRDLTESIKRGAVQIILLLEGGGGGQSIFQLKY
jgi:hypothetical protein